jgi:2-polyprenyl-6-methoxyphenol hydroxylase-like FAD-dependent oxidoreductase
MGSSSFWVLIIGGGSCGLTLAQGLKKHNSPYTLYERGTVEEFTHRSRDWGSLLHWGKPYLEKCLPQELYARRAEMYVDPLFEYETVSASLISDGETGKEIKRPPSLEGAVRVSRGKIRRLFSQSLNIEYGKRLDKIIHDENTITAHFADGSTATGSILIGCDGGHSKTHEYIIGPKAAKGFGTDYTMMNTWKRLPAEKALALRAKHPIISQSINTDTPWGNLIAILDKPSEGSPPEKWKFQVYSGWRRHPRKADLDMPEKSLAHFKMVLEQQAEPFKSVSATFKEGDVVPVDAGWNFAPRKEFAWDNPGGRVTIAGDAAHSSKCSHCSAQRTI